MDENNLLQQRSDLIDFIQSIKLKNDSSIKILSEIIFEYDLDAEVKTYLIEIIKRLHIEDGN